MFMIDKNVGLGCQGWVVYLRNIGQDGVKYLVLVWGLGVGIGLVEYEWFFECLVLYGFIVYFEVFISSGLELKFVIIWLQQ